MHAALPQIIMLFVSVIMDMKEIPNLHATLVSIISQAQMVVAHLL